MVVLYFVVLYQHLPGDKAEKSQYMLSLGGI
jgi:hypothetical protein